MRKLFEVLSPIDIAENPEVAIDEFLYRIAGKKVIIYGASLIGEVLSKCLRKLNIPVAFVIDRDATRIGELYGVPVNEPNILTVLKKDAADYVMILAISEKHLNSVFDDIKALNVSFDIISNGQMAADYLQMSICALNHRKGNDETTAICGDCSVLDNICPVLKERADDVMKAPQSDKSTLTTMIGYALSNYCTLNCKFCCESLPLYGKDSRKYVPTETVIHDIRRVAEASNRISIIEFIGGEPFLHKGLPDIVNACLEIPNAAFVHIFTNGTVAPSNELLGVLGNARVAVYISNYTGFLNKKQEALIKQTKQMLIGSNIQFVYGGEKKWFDFSIYEYHDDDETVLNTRYLNCFLHHCNRLHNGVLYVCPHHYAGTQLGILSESNTVRIHELDDSALVLALDEFKKIPFAESCRYCEMPYNARTVLAGD